MSMHTPTRLPVRSKPQGDHKPPPSMLQNLLAKTCTQAVHNFNTAGGDLLKPSQNAFSKRTSKALPKNAPFENETAASYPKTVADRFAKYEAAYERASASKLTGAVCAVCFEIVPRLDKLIMSCCRKPVCDTCHYRRLQARMDKVPVPSCRICMYRTQGELNMKRRAEERERAKRVVAKKYIESDEEVH